MIQFRRVLGAALLLAVVAAGGMLPGQAARDTQPDATPRVSSSGHRFEILVFEAESCGYCEIFRRDVAPGYRLAPLAAVAPLRYVDIGKVDIDKIGLTSRLHILPTTVLMKDGREVERVPGLTKAETYYTLLKHMISKHE